MFNNFNIGDKVGAIQSADKETVRFYGYGTYKGEQDHPEYGFPNPKIELDNGKVVWGCECWWASENKVKEMIGDRKVVVVEL